MSVKKELTQALAQAIAQVVTLKKSDISSLIEKPKNSQFGDLAFPCFSLAKEWKKSPPACAEQLLETLELPAGFSEATPTGPFINFRFDREFFTRKSIENALSTRGSETKGETVVVEYSSPNIAKPFHVGHLRATLIGNCLDRVYRFLGWNTVSINHLGDWGTQFGFVWAGCKLWGYPENPTVSSLVDLYRKATELKQRQEQDEVPPEQSEYPDINEIARAYFLDLEKGEDYAHEFWKQCVEVSMEYLKKTYTRLDVRFDHYIGESFYSDKLEELHSELESHGILSESQGALGVDLGEQLGFARIATPDGRSLYLTRDLATAKYRAERFQFDRSIYVVGAPQSLHFQQIKGVLTKLGRDYADKIMHVAFGHVKGMKTRGKGNFIELNDFLDEAYERSLEAYRKQVGKRPEGLDEEEVARGVALSAIIFSNLSRSNIKDVHFSWEHALAFQGDSGPYLLYACARINGIKEKAAEAGISLEGPFSFKEIKEESAHQVLLLLSEFDEVLQRTIDDNEPSYLASYALDLAKSFSKAYLELKVVSDEVDTELARARLSLFEAVRKIIAQCLSLLGIKPLERM